MTLRHTAKAPPVCWTENAGNKPNNCPARHPARAAQCRFEHHVCPLQSDRGHIPILYHTIAGGHSNQPGTDAHWAASPSARVLQGMTHPKHPLSPRGVHPACLHPPHRPQGSWPSRKRHDATAMAAARAPWPERVAGESRRAGSSPRAVTAGPVVGRPAPSAPHCEFPSIFSPVINNSLGIRHQLPEQRGRGATHHPKQTEPLSQQLCPSEPSSRTFKYTLGSHGD